MEFVNVDINLSAANARESFELEKNAMRSVTCFIEHVTGGTVLAGGVSDGLYDASSLSAYPYIDAVSVNEDDVITFTHVYVCEGEMPSFTDEERDRIKPKMEAQAYTWMSKNDCGNMVCTFDVIHCLMENAKESPNAMIRRNRNIFGAGGVEHRSTKCKDN